MDIGGLVILLNIYFVSRIVPVHWDIACVISLYKGKGNKCDCSTFRCISLLSVAGKVYG